MRDKKSGQRFFSHRFENPSFVAIQKTNRLEALALTYYSLGGIQVRALNAWLRGEPVPLHGHLPHNAIEGS
jgi:hypothetical protein